MLPYSDPETLRLLVEQRQEEVRRAADGSHRFVALLARAARRSVQTEGRPERVLRMPPSRRPA